MPYDPNQPRDELGRWTDNKGFYKANIYYEEILNLLKSERIINDGKSSEITQITDSAIDRVPYIEVDGYSQAENEYIQNQHKELLRVARDCNDNKEVAFVFRKDLSDKSIYIGSDDELNFGSASFGKGVDLFVMHNHPRNSSFSMSDISFFLGKEDVKSISIVKNNGFVEIITKTEMYTVKKALLCYARLYKKTVKTNIKKEVDKLIGNLLSNNGGLIDWKR